MPSAPSAGVLLVDKPAGVSSFGAIARLRRVYGRKLGHAGTLDPFATGLLLVLHGRATRLAPYLTGMDKRYRAVVQFGATSTTGDPEGEIVETAGRTDLASVAAALPAFVGEIEQIPPAASAIHIDGERAYKRFRRGEDVIVPPRRVRIHAIDIVDFDAHSQTVTLDICCGPGTYVRTIASDLGIALTCGAYVVELRRTAIGRFRVEAAASPDTISDGAPGAVAWLPALAAVPELVRHSVTPAERTAIGYGQRVPAHGCEGTVALVDGEDLVAVGETEGDQIAPRIVLEPA